VRTHMTELICPTPLVVDNVVYVHGGGLKSSGSLALRCGGRGDVTDSHVLWTSKEVTSPPAPVKQDGFLYWVDGGGTACCMDATTGTLRYQEKLPVQGRFAAYASPIAAEGKIYAVTRKHGTFVLPAQPEFRIIAHNRFGSDDSDFNGSPVISNGRVLLRSDRALYCVTKTVDPFMGDWKGRGETDMGEAFEFVGQVIALGDNQYRMNFLEEFDSAYLDPMYVLNGELKGDTFRYTTEGGEYTGEIILAGPRARGTYKGSEGGRFEMQRVERLSPTLGAAAPKDAIVLFDGTNLDQWERMTGAVGLIDLAQIVGGDNAVAYLGTLFQTDGDQQAVLEIGSDDGVKVWLNGEVVHTNNANRGVTPGQDKITVNLVDGQNTLMFKVTNGAGGWGACARLANSNGKTLATISEAVEENGEWTVTKEFLKENQGFLTVWWVCGPYRAEGKAGTDLMDVEFEPEYLGRDAPWQLVERQQAPKDPRWILKDGAMQVRDGNIATKRRTFTDFTLHVEFKTPFMPKARGQGRGNSGVYLQNRYEIQVLDSYGLEGLDNECGGIYQVGRPHVNMCAPPEQWQTYDIDFTAAKMVNGQQSPAVVTVIHSGITIHNQLKIPRETGGAMDTHLLQPGGIYLQDHSNPVQYRNIWIAPK
jgi:hypothetical protein